MGREKSGWRMPSELAERVWSKRRSQDAMVQLGGGIEAASARIDSGYKPEAPEYVWNPDSSRYHWRRDGTKDGKMFRKGSFHVVPKGTMERRRYDEHIRTRRERHAQQKRGNRLKQR